MRCSSHEKPAKVCPCAKESRRDRLVEIGLRVSLAELLRLLDAPCWTFSGSRRFGLSNICTHRATNAGRSASCRHRAGHYPP